MKRRGLLPSGVVDRRALATKAERYRRRGPRHPASSVAPRAADDRRERRMESLAVETSHDLDHTCSIQRLPGPQGGNCFHRPPLVVAAAPPPLLDVAHRSAAAPSCQPGTIPHVLPRLAATSSDESLLGNVVTGHQLPARRVRHDVVGDARRPGSSGRVSALQRRIRRGGLARARGPRGVGRHQPWEHDASSPSSFDDPHLDTPLMRGMHALPPRRAMTESTSTQLLPALARAQLTCGRRGATCGRAAGVRTPGTRACVCLRPRHALACGCQGQAIAWHVAGGCAPHVFAALPARDRCSGICMALAIPAGLYFDQFHNTDRTWL